MWKTAIGRVRLSGIVEGVSFLLLVFVGMSLKYLADWPMGVTVLGPIHGALFLIFCLFLLLALVEGKLSFLWCVIAFFAALIPFGPFLIDRKLKALEQDKD